MSEYPQDDGARQKRELVTATCLVCGETIKTRTGARYCARHFANRYEDMPVLVPWPFFHGPVKFTPPPAIELLRTAVDSIRILRPDGTLDAVRTQVEKGRWLTKMLQGSWELMIPE